MDFNVNSGLSQNPYKEFTFTLAAFQSLPVHFAFNYFRVMELTGTTLSVLFGGNPDLSPFKGAGVGVQFTQVFDRVTLVNTGAAPITLTIALAVGEINDSRLSVTSALSLVYTQANPLNIISSGNTLTALADVVCPATTLTNFGGGGATNRTLMIKNPNGSGGALRVGGNSTSATSGIILDEGDVLSLDTTGNIWIYNPNAFPITIAGLAVRS